ncbi:MAG: hypothetical protein R2795_08450 [Saprospiraceae bacterium]
MDIDNILDESTSPSTDLIIDGSIRDFLAETAKWGKFLSIVGFVFVGLGMLGMLFGGGAMLYADLPGAGGGIFMLVYLIMFGITIIPLIYLYNFATKMQVALRNNNQQFLRDAFENHKSMFKFYGIFMAIMLGIYALILIFGIGAAVALG